MKFTERFFKFPIKIYDSVSVKQVLKEEFKSMDKEGGPEIISPAWVKGYARLPYWVLNDLYYFDSYSPGEMTIEQIADNPEEGFDMTSIFHKDFGSFDCVWKSAKFEYELNKFIDAYEKWLDAEQVKEEAKQTL